MVVALGVWEMERSRVSLVALKRVVAGSTLQQGSGRDDSLQAGSILSPQAKEAGLI